MAVYASHLPLDAHPTLGNNVLLARALGLEPSGGFARYKTVDVGVRGESDVATQDLNDRAEAFAQLHGGACTVDRLFQLDTEPTVGGSVLEPAHPPTR